jgi:hypothetical protein
MPLSFAACTTWGFQWLIPVLTGGISVMTAVQGERRRPQTLGILTRTAQWLRVAA